MASHTSAQPSEADLSEKQEVEANVSRMTSSRGLEFDVDEEARLVRKIDWMILPITTLLYLLSFLDRSNIGNAKIEGLVTDLKIRDYPSLLTIYFVGYVIAEVPCNWILKATNPPLWLPTLTLLWGIVSVSMGLVHNEAGIYAARFFLGVTEAGLFPGVVYVFSRFYKRSERTARVSFFFSAAAAAGAFGGVLAFGLTKMDGIGGKRGWSWLFIVEGLLTIVVSLAAYFIMPNYPHVSKWFNAREKQIIEKRLREDSDAVDVEGFRWSEVWRAMTSLQVYGYCFLFHGFSFGLYTLSLFLPSIIQGLGYKSWQAQLLSVPPYFFAFIVTMSCAYATWRVKFRAPFIVGGALVATLGYIVLITSPTIGGRYTAVFLCAGGIYSGNAILLAWPSENLMGQTYRATALAMVISIGNLGAIIGTQLYRVPLGGLKNTNYHIAYGLTIVWLAIGISSATALWWGLRRANLRLDAAVQSKCDGEPSPSPSQVGLAEGNGAWKASFRYQL